LGEVFVVDEPIVGSGHFFVGPATFAFTRFKFCLIDHDWCSLVFGVEEFACVIGVFEGEPFFSLISGRGLDAVDVTMVFCVAA
jgi:hypothetical protein